MHKFFQGGANLGYGQKGGGGGGGQEAYVRCYTLHLLGGENDTRGANAPPRIQHLIQSNYSTRKKWCHRTT